MADIIGLVLPFFGMILLGYVVARITRQPVEALGWLNTFIIYIARPALFFKLVAKTPIEQLTRIDFISAGALLNVLTAIRRTGKQIVFQHPNHLVAELFGIVGLKAVATIIPAKY